MAESEGGEKTEEPTRKKLDDALKRGDVAKSQELNVWFGLAAATLAISIFGDGAVSSLGKTLTRFLKHPETIAIDGTSLRTMARGMPGNPPPAPTSTTVAPGGTWGATASESATCRSATSAGSASPMRRMREFHLARSWM